MSNCQHELMAAGKPYPRSCQTCGLFGQCHKRIPNPFQKQESQVNYEAEIQKLTDRGLLIEAGWVALRFATLQDAPEIQVREMRKAFFAGAQHLFASITGVMDDGEEPTADDLRRMEMIHVELEAFVDALKREARGMVDPV